MKKILVLICFTFTASFTFAQTLTLEWQSKVGEKPQSSRGGGLGENVIDDFTGDGTADFIVIDDKTNSVYVVSGKDRKDRIKFDAGFPLPGNSGKIEGFFLENVAQGVVSMALCNNENISELQGLRSDDQILLEGQLITFPKTHFLLEIGDYDRDGLYELLFANKKANRAELWGVN